MSGPAIPTQVSHKVQLLLVRAADAPGAQFEAALRGLARAIAATGRKVGLAVALPPAVMGLSTQGASGSGLPAIDAVLEVWDSVTLPFSGLAASFAGAGERLAGLLDQKKSCALAGTEHIVMPGE